MRLSLDALATLDAIARKGSFAAAAEELHRVPSPVTYVVQKLEQDLGLPIFDRSGHRAKLTPEGTELLREGRHLLRAAGELEERMQRLARGWESELAITADEIIPIERMFPWSRRSTGSTPAPACGFPKKSWPAPGKRCTPGGPNWSSAFRATRLPKAVAACCHWATCTSCSPSRRHIRSRTFSNH